MSSPPPAKDYLIWITMIMAVVILFIFLGMMIWLMMIAPHVFIGRAELFIGAFLGLLSAAGIALGLMQQRKSNNST